MENELTINEAIFSDISIIIKFLRCMLEEMEVSGGHSISTDESEWLHIYENIEKEFQNPDHVYYIAKNQLTPIGFIEARIKPRTFVFKTKKVLHIHSIYVDIPNRRRGIGSALLETVIEWGKKKGVEEIELSVLINNAAQTLYEKFGFRSFEVELIRKL